MSTLHIVYACTPVGSSESALNECLARSGVLKVKTLGVEAGHLVFALLLSTIECVVTPPNNVMFVGRQQKLQRSDAPKLSFAALSRLSMNRQSKLETLVDNSVAMTVDEKVYKKARKVYRKQQNEEITEKNWKQHINRNRALKKARQVIEGKHKCESSVFMVDIHSVPSRYSVAPSWA